MTKKSQARQARDQLERDRAKNNESMVETYQDVMGLLSTPADVYKLLRNPEIQENLPNKEHIATVLTTMTSDIDRLRKEALAARENAAVVMSKSKFENGDSLAYIENFEKFQEITTVFTLNVTPALEEVMDAVNESARIANEKREAAQATEEVIKVESELVIP